MAVSCKDRMHKIMAEEMEWVAGEAADWKGVMERSFSRMDAEVVSCHGGEQNASCRCELQAPKCDHVGSTAVVAVVASDCIVVANCGDSRAVLCRKGVPVPLSSDHKATNTRIIQNLVRDLSRDLTVFFLIDFSRIGRMSWTGSRRQVAA